MPISKLENNFRRLLHQCKKLARDGRKEEVWRLDKFVSHLERLFVQMEVECSGQIADDVLTQYKQELQFLKKVLETENKSEVEWKFVAAQHLPVPSASSRGDAILRQVKTQTTARYTCDMRRELLGETDGALRLRNAGDALENDNADIDAVLKHHHDVQTKLAEDFLQLTRNLKENVTVAGHVVREDNKALVGINSTADKNYVQLGKESQRLEKHAYRSYCDCGTYCVLILVILCFIGMVLFMRLFPKR